jgi:hypothetical protein
MRLSPESAGNRREFFRGVARYGLAGILGGIAVVTLRQRDKCINGNLCWSCRALAQSGRPWRGVVPSFAPRINKKPELISARRSLV